MKLFKKKEKKPEQLLKEMRTDEQIRLMNAIKQNAADGKPESDNLIMLKEMSYHATIDAEDEKRETERSNRRSKPEKFLGIFTPIVVMLTSFWNAKHDCDGDNVQRSDGGRRLGRMLDGIVSKVSDFCGRFKK